MRCNIGVSRLCLPLILRRCCKYIGGRETGVGGVLAWCWCSRPAGRAGCCGRGLADMFTLPLLKTKMPYPIRVIAITETNKKLSVSMLFLSKPVGNNKKITDAQTPKVALLNHTEFQHLLCFSVIGHIITRK